MGLGGTGLSQAGSLLNAQDFDGLDERKEGISKRSRAKYIHHNSGQHFLMKQQRQGFSRIGAYAL